MPYSKKSPADFKKDLDQKLYQSATGARRAVGKFADWSEADRAKARKMIDKSFGEASAAPAKKKAKKAKGKKKAKKKKKVAVKKASSKKAPAKKVAKKAAVKKAAPKKAAAKPAAKAKAAPARTTKTLATAWDESQRLGTYEQALANLKTIRDIDPEHDVSRALEEVTEGIRESMARLRGLQSPVAAGANGAEKPAPSPAVSPDVTPGLAGGALPGAPGTFR